MSYSQPHKDNGANANDPTTTTIAPNSNLPERVENTLAELLTLFLPQTDGSSADGKSRKEREQEADDRFAAAFERAVETLEGSGVVGSGSRSKGKGRDEEDVNGSGDLIKKKLIRENNSPEKALRFSTLYSRLLTQTVLTRKWAMLYFLYKLSDSDVNAAAAHGHQARRRQDHRYHHQHRYGHQEERHRHRNIAHRPAAATVSASDDMNSPSSSDGYRPDNDARSTASPTVTSSRVAASRSTARNSRTEKAKMGREFIVDSARFNDTFSEAEPGAVASADAASGLRVRSPMIGQRPMSSASGWSARSGLTGGAAGSRESQWRREERSTRADRIPRSRPDVGHDRETYGNDDEENGFESVRREDRSGRYTRTTTRSTQQYRTTRRINGAGIGTVTGTSTEAESDVDSEITADNDYRNRRQRDRREQQRQQGQQQGGDGGDDDVNFQEQFRITNPSEPTLLRGLPNMLQGLPNEHISFVSEPEPNKRKGIGNGGGGEAMQICLPSTLSAPMISVLHLLAEPALLYRELNAFAEGSSTSAPSSRGGDSSIGARSFHARRKDHHHHRHNHHHTARDGDGNADNNESDGGGLVGQSLRAAIGSELRSYLDLVADLEKKIRSALSAAGDVGNEDAGAGNSDDYDEKRIRKARKMQKEQMARLAEAGVTLKKCVVLMRDATMKLRLMSAIVYACQGKKGGEVISITHSFAITHGDPFVCSFAERLLSHVTQPFYDMLRQWIYDGELSDPFLEFFVSENVPEDGNLISGGGGGDVRKGGATSVWEDKYKLNTKMIPSIVTEEFVNKVFLIGKSLNFIRYGCSDGSWVEHYSKEASRELHYGDNASLERSIGEAYETTMARLTTLMADKFKLFVHLEALKKYLLLGAGDFIAVLMESLAPNLDRPANTQYRHTLTAQLEHAVRNSNAQHEPADVLGRLDSRMLELSHGEIGWDVFTLEYKVGPPVDVVVTPMASRQYLRVFNFLWRVKRVEFALASTWRRCMTGARGILGSIENDGSRKSNRNARKETNDGGGNKAMPVPVQPNLASDWKCAHACIAEMIHLVAQLQYYILFEVIEASWAELQTAIRQPECTLDGLITAHARYLTRITRKGLLGSSSTSNKHDRSNANANDNTNANISESANANANANANATTTPGPSQPSNDHHHHHPSHRQTTFPSSTSPSTKQTPDFPVQLHELLKTMLAYRDAVDGLYSFSVAEFTRRQEQSARYHHHYHHDNNNTDNPLQKTTSSSSSFSTTTTADADAAHSNSNPLDPLGPSGPPDPPNKQEKEDPMLQALRKRLASLATDFRVRVHVLLADLYAQPDPDLRWLAMVMNFNDVYGGVAGKGKGRSRGRVRGKGEGGRG